MDKAYSGLRRTRKRAHSTKCPCCYSSEEEQENHASANKEKVKNHGIQNNVKRSSTRKRKLASDDDIDSDKDVSKAVVSPGASGDESQNSKKTKKNTPSKKPKKNGEKRKTISKQDADSNESNGEELEQSNKQSGKGAKGAVKKRSKTSLSMSNKKDENVQGNNLTNIKESVEKEASTQIQSKPKKSRKKNKKREFKSDTEDINKNEIETEEKCLNTSKKNNGKARKVTSTGNIGALKQSAKDTGEERKLFNNSKKPVTKTNKAENDKQNKTRIRNGKSRDVLGGPVCELNKEKVTGFLGSNKQAKTFNTNTGSLVQRKIEVFDHLFCELKKCPGFSKTTVSSAAELLLQLTADKLKSLLSNSLSKKAKTGVDQKKQAVDNLPSSSSKAKTTVSLSEPKRKCTESEKALSSETKNASCLSSPRKTTSGQAEEVKLSQAAEALVSFRTNPTILRQEKADADHLSARSTDKVIAPNNAEKKSEVSPSSSMQIVTTSTEVRASQASDSCYVNVLSQSQPASHLPSSLVLRGALHQTVPFPASIEANLRQVATVPQNLMNLSQLTSHLNSASTVSVPVGPRVNISSSENSRMAMMNPTGVQNFRALFCQHTQPSNTQTSVGAQAPVSSLSPGGNNQQLQPQQPLKGMEDVVSCVGSRSATNVLWNIKPTTPPVVYLTSPQTLSGVRARNYIPQNEGHRPLPFTASVAKVHSVGIPKTSLNSASTSVLTLGKVTLVSQAASHSTSHAVSVTGQRPILPREHRAPYLFARTTQSPSQLPVTTVAGPTSCVGNMPLQLGGLHVTSPLNTRQPPISTVVTQASVTQASVTQAPVVQVPIPCVTTGQITAVSSAVLTPVSAKQAVKKFVHERTKSAELKRTGSFSNLLPNEPVSSSTVAEQSEMSMASVPSSQSGKSLHQPEKQSTSNQPEFNLHQAASALLSISSQDGLDATDTAQPGAGDGDDSLDEHDDEVVFTSKGVFRVGDVDVDPKYNSIGREGYSCGKCGKIFTSLSYLARHIKRVCPDMSCRKWKCTMCDKAFRHPFGLQQHIYTHTGERPHKCSQCPKAFYSSNDLRRHSRIHSGERPYHCKHCDKSFATTISLKTHTYIHTGEKPHKCPHCPKTFATSSKLGRHIVTHSKQRPFACEHCPKSFNRSGDLRRHNMHVHESRDKPIEYEDCSTPFNTAANVSIPGDQDSIPGQTHQCSVCGQAYNSSSELTHHMLCHNTPVSPVSNHISSKKSDEEMDHLDESTESGSVDSN